MAKSDAAESATVFLDGDRDNGFSRGFPTLRALFWRADIGFVHLNLAVKVVSAGTDHGPSQLMQPSPGRPVATETKDALEAQGADAILLAGDKPHRQEPLPQRLMGVLEDRSCRHRNLPAATSTAQQTPRHFRRFVRHSAAWADEPARPAKPAEIRPASRFRGEPRFELLERRGVINSRLGRRGGIDHAPTLSAGIRCVKCIPTLGKKSA